MPKILTKCISDIEQTKDADKAWPFCISKLKNAGLIQKGSGDKHWTLTAKGKERSKELYESEHTTKHSLYQILEAINKYYDTTGPILEVSAEYKQYLLTEASTDKVDILDLSEKLKNSLKTKVELPVEKIRLEIKNTINYNIEASPEENFKNQLIEDSTQKKITLSTNDATKLLDNLNSNFVSTVSSTLGSSYVNPFRLNYSDTNSYINIDWNDDYKTGKLKIKLEATTPGKEYSGVILKIVVTGTVQLQYDTLVYDEPSNTYHINAKCTSLHMTLKGYTKNYERWMDSKNVQTDEELEVETDIDYNDADDNARIELNDSDLNVDTRVGISESLSIGGLQCPECGSEDIDLNSEEGLECQECGYTGDFEFTEDSRIDDSDIPYDEDELANNLWKAQHPESGDYYKDDEDTILNKSHAHRSDLIETVNKKVSKFVPAVELVQILANRTADKYGDDYPEKFSVTPDGKILEVPSDRLHGDILEYQDEHNFEYINYSHRESLPYMTSIDRGILHVRWGKRANVEDGNWGAYISSKKITNKQKRVLINFLDWLAIDKGYAHHTFFTNIGSSYSAHRDFKSPIDAAEYVKDDSTISEVKESLDEVYKERGPMCPRCGGKDFKYNADDTEILQDEEGNFICNQCGAHYNPDEPTFIESDPMDLNENFYNSTATAYTEHDSTQSNPLRFCTVCHAGKRGQIAVDNLGRCKDCHDNNNNKSLPVGQAVRSYKPKISERRDNPLVGGEGDDTDFDDVSANELQMGIKVELEHISENEDLTEAEKVSIASDIALDHLATDKNYYTKLKTILVDPDEEYVDPKLEIVDEGKQMKGWRIIKVNGKEWNWKIGSQNVIAKNLEDNETRTASLEDITGWTPDEIERGQHKKYFSLTPKDIAEWLKKGSDLKLGLVDETTISNINERRKDCKFCGGYGWVRSFKNSKTSTPCPVCERAWIDKLEKESKTDFERDRSYSINLNLSYLEYKKLKKTTKIDPKLEVVDESYDPNTDFKWALFRGTEKVFHAIIEHDDLLCDTACGLWLPFPDIRATTSYFEPTKQNYCPLCVEELETTEFLKESEDYYPSDYSKAATGMTKKGTMSINFLSSFFGNGASILMAHIKNTNINSKFKSLNNLIKFVNNPDKNASISVSDLLSKIDGLDVETLTASMHVDAEMPEEGFVYRLAIALISYIIFHMSEDNIRQLAKKESILYNELIKLEILSR
jgi:hypothetical protein